MMSPTADSNRPTPAALASRLRLLQVDFADAPAAERQEHLAEELDRALATQSPEQRKATLGELMTHFPAWQNDDEPPTPAAGESEELSDPAVLVTRLVDLAAGLDDKQRRAIAQRLAGADLVPEQEGAGWSAEAAAQAREKFQVAADAAVDARRTLQIAGELAEFAINLERIVRSTWRELAPKSDLLSNRRLQVQLSAFVAGDEDVSRTQVIEELERVRQMAAGMIAAVGQVGRQFTARYASKLAPLEIETLARHDKRWHESADVACWRKFKELAEAMDEAAMEREVKQIITDYTTSLVKGLNR
ncbi:MAG: hypothetical protein WD009_01350 [Phycisphaeraceae bacterium]